MNRTPFPPLQIAAYWADLTDHLVELVGCFPADKLDWRPTSDVHHRADILRYAEQLGIDTSSVQRRRPL